MSFCGVCGTLAAAAGPERRARTMTDFHEVEATDGVRFSWNVWPSSRLEATRMVVPLGCLYTPLKPIENLPLLPYEPIVCRGTCKSILNPYCRIDFNAKIWVCPFCFQRNHFPPHYSEVSENNLPAELIPNYTTIEYALPRAPAGPPAFLWVVDTCLEESELQSLKDSLEQVLQLLSANAPHALLGLITFGTTVQIHELGYEHCAKSYSFSGKKDLEPPRLHELLGLGAPSRGRGSQQQQDGRSAEGRFLLPVSEAEVSPPRGLRPRARPQRIPLASPLARRARLSLSSDLSLSLSRSLSRSLSLSLALSRSLSLSRSSYTLLLYSPLPLARAAQFAISNILSELRNDPWPVESGMRASRCTGVALSAAVSLLETNFANTGAHVMLFTGGPCTIGPGQMAGKELNEPMRSHSDIEKENTNTKFVRKASKHYAAIAKRACAAGHAIDVFACALDQVGLLEMRPVIERTGGYVVMSESFTGNIFKQSFQAVFSQDSKGEYLRMAFGASLEVCSAPRRPPPRFRLPSASLPPPFRLPSASLPPPVCLPSASRLPPFRLPSASLPPPVCLPSTSLPPPFRLPSASLPPPVRLPSASLPPPRTQPPPRAL